MAYKVLLPFDSSVCSLKAAEYTAQLMTTNKDIHCTALFVRAFTRDLAYFLGASIDLYDSSLEKIKMEIESRLNNVFKDMMSRVKIEIMEGDPVRVICETIKEDGYDEVIMGFMGGSAISNLFRGNINCRVVNKVSCPVRIIK